MKKLLTVLLISCSFSSLIGQYTTNGSATELNESCIRVTQAITTQVGSAFFNEPIDLSQAFSYSGTMFFGVDDAGADGMTFILATDPSIQGLSGGGIGYQGITPSLIVEFDTWQNIDLNDLPQDHMGIMSNGNPDHNSADALAPLVVLPNIEDGQEHCFTIMWDPSVPVFEATLSGTSITYNGDISALFPPGVDVYYGYTGSTGGAVNEQRVCLYNTAELEQLEISEVGPLCQSDEVQTFEANLVGGEWGGAANIWGQMNPADFDPGTYAVTYTLGDFECEYADEIMVEILPGIEQNLLAQTNIDCTELSGSLEISADNGIAPYSYAWSNGATTSSIENLSAGTYTLTVTDDNGCEAVEEYQITAESIPQLMIVSIIDQFCNDLNEIEGGSIVVEVIGGDAPYSYSLDGGISSQSEGTFEGLTEPTGTITVIDNNNCSSSLDFDLAIASYPTVEIQTSNLELCGESITLTVDSQSGETLLWSTDETENSIIVETAGLITATLTNSFLCTAEAEVSLTECLDYDIPNVFTPNNDNVNETFGLVTESQNITFFLSVYSRWGQLVYEGSENWDGNVDGKPFPADVLGYVMEVNVGGNIVVERGDITLVR